MTVRVQGRPGGRRAYRSNIQIQCTLWRENSFLSRCVTLPSQISIPLSVLDSISFRFQDYLSDSALQIYLASSRQKQYRVASKVYYSICIGWPSCIKSTFSLFIKLWCCRCRFQNIQLFEAKSILRIFIGEGWKDKTW